MEIDAFFMEALGNCFHTVSIKAGFLLEVQKPQPNQTEHSERKLDKAKAYENAKFIMYK